MQRRLLYEQVVAKVLEYRQIGHDVVVISDIDMTVLVPGEYSNTQQPFLIPQVLELHNMLHHIGCPIYFVTARAHGVEGNNHQYTDQELRGYGLQFERLFTRIARLYKTDTTNGVDFDAFTSSAEYKLDVRRFFASCRKTVLINIGDLDGDFYGGGFVWGLKVPPAFYRF